MSFHSATWISYIMRFGIAEGRLVSAALFSQEPNDTVTPSCHFGREGTLSGKSVNL